MAAIWDKTCVDVSTSIVVLTTGMLKFLFLIITILIGGNAEAQYYRQENAVVSNGTLKIIAKQEEFGGRSFTSARLRTLGLADIDLTRPHVRLEARIQVPSGPSKGLWPAFWMLPSNFETSQWPLGGELDIMEWIGREPNHVSRILLVM